MERTVDVSTERRIESLTAHLLECYEELDLIYGLTRRLGTTLAAQESATLVLSEALEIFEADFGWMTPSAPVLGERDARRESPFHPLVRGAEESQLEPLRLAVAGDLTRRGRSHIYYSAAEELVDPGGLPAHALLCSLVRTESRVYGTLCVGRRGVERPFTARDLKLCDVLTSQAAIAFENALLHRRRMEEEQALIRIEEEIRLARDIQSKLLPHDAPSIPGYDIAGRGLPARSVGGDYYDFIPMSDDRLAICLADVCGHGMPAALLMANLQATIRSHALASVSPSECIRRSNRLLYRSTDAQRFATCFYGVLELASGRLTYSNAGHDHPVLMGPGGVGPPLATGGLMLGVREDPGYEEGALLLTPGDVLVVYSDGITETFDAADRLFGMEGLLAALSRSSRGTAIQIVDSILEAVEEHAKGRPQADDRTLVVLRRL